MTTTTTNLKRFWRLLERLCYPAAVRRQWQRWLKDEYPLVSAFLRPLPEPAESYPKLGFHACPRPYRVVSDGSGGYVGICDETGERISLTGGDIVLYEIDFAKVRRSVAGALGVRPGETPVERLRATFQLGTYSPGDGHRFAAFCTVQREAAEFERVVATLCATSDQPFLLLSPTDEMCSAAAESLLHKHRGGLIPLRDAISIGGDGAFHAAPGSGTLVAEFCRLAIGTAAAGLSPRAESIFRKEGRLWRLCYFGKQGHAPHSKGMRQLQYLLAHQGREVPSLTLHSLDSGRAEVEDGSSGELLDEPALRKYRECLDELYAELAEAQANGDIGRVERIQLEIQQLTDEIKRAVGLGGRRRKKTDAERARVAVNQSLNRAVAAITEVIPELGRHLDCSLDTGMTVRYSPESPVNWDL